MVAFGPSIIAAAQTSGLPPSLIAGLVQTESNFNQFAIGGAGEIGLTQLSPSVARGINPYDPTANVTAGASYLASLVSRYGSLNAGLSAYNTGSPSSSAGAAYAQRVINAAAQNSQLDATLPATTAALGGITAASEAAAGMAAGNAAGGAPSITGTLPSTIFGFDPAATGAAVKAAIPNGILFVIGAAIAFLGFRSMFT